MSHTRIIVRSFLFWSLFFIWTILYGIAALPILLTMQQHIIGYVGKPWSIVTLWLLKQICGLKYRITGLKHLPQRPYIVASRHESAWETIFFLKYFGNPCFVLKRELAWIPIYGWYLMPMGMIAIDRASGISAAKSIARQVGQAAANQRIIGIFPEGTRVEPGQRAELKGGVYLIHRAAPQLPIIPVRLNSGKYWAKGSWLIASGTIEVTFLPPLMKNNGFSKAELLQKLENCIN